jgi:segregation and condensation protein A
MAALNQYRRDEKPLWLQQPWAVLFDLVKLQKLRPWDFNIATILSAFLSEMRRKGYIDFTASGMALLSSATLFRMKSEQILKFEEPPRPRQPKPAEFIPPPLQLPFRYEYTSTTLEHLVDVLREALKMEPLVGLRPPKLAQLEPAVPILQQVDEFFLKIDEKIDSLYERLAAETKCVGEIRFSDLVKSMDHLEAVRTFLLVLFLATRGLVTLRQEEDFGEIIIVPTERRN